MKTRLVLGCVAVCLYALDGVSSAVAQTGAVAVVVSEKNTVSNLSIPELRKLFAGETHSWTGGQTVKLIVRAPGAHERTVLLKLLGMSESEYKRYWVTQVFRGDAQFEPVALFSNAMQREALGIFPGALALVEVQDVRPGMKMVKIDGLLPGRAGYVFN